MIERSFVIWLWEWALQYARISVSYVRKALYFRGEKKKCPTETKYQRISMRFHVSFWYTAQ